MNTRAVGCSKQKAKNAFQPLNLACLRKQKERTGARQHTHADDWCCAYIAFFDERNSQISPTTIEDIAGSTALLPVPQLQIKSARRMVRWVPSAASTANVTPKIPDTISNTCTHARGKQCDVPCRVMMQLEHNDEASTVHTIYRLLFGAVLLSQTCGNGYPAALARLTYTLEPAKRCSRGPPHASECQKTPPAGN